MVQGLCLGGEYGGAIPYVAEHVSGERLRLLYRLATNLLRRWEIVVVAVVLGTRGYFGEDVFNAWAWRVPSVLLALQLENRCNQAGHGAFCRGRLSRHSPGLVFLLAQHHRPGDARRLVRQRHGYDQGSRLRPLAESAQ
jgi:MFS family permease